MAAAEEAKQIEEPKPQLELVPKSYQDEEDEKVREGWMPSTLAQVDWALMRVAAMEKEIADNEEIAQQHHAAIDAKTRRLNDKVMKGVSFFRSVLATYAQQNRTELLGGGKKKSRAFQHGTLGFRTKPGLLETVDREKLMEWAQAQPVEEGLVRVKEDPALEEIKSFAEREGLVPPGMKWRPEVEEVSIRVDMKEVR